MDFTYGHDVFMQVNMYGIHCHVCQNHNFYTSKRSSTFIGLDVFEFIGRFFEFQNL